MKYNQSMKNMKNEKWVAVKCTGVGENAIFYCELSNRDHIQDRKDWYKKFMPEVYSKGMKFEMTIADSLKDLG